MLTLILESSTNQTLIAIFEKDRLLCSKEISGSHEMLLNLQITLKELDLRPDAFNCIIAGTGPGSYVGLRVSASIAKMLSYSHKIPLIGICSLMGFTPEQEGFFLAVSDARMKGAYVLEGEKKEGIVSYCSNAELCTLEQLKNKTEKIPLLIGNNLTSLKQSFEASYPKDSPSWHEISFNPALFLSIARTRLEQGSYSLDGTLELLFL